MYLNNSTRCAHRHEDCGMRTLRTRVKPGCLPCQCSRGSDQCDLIGSECTCRDGGIYFMGSANRCVRDIDECRTLYSITRYGHSTCAKCLCPPRQKRCHLLGNKCDCIDGIYYMRGSKKCVQNRADCIFGSPTSPCAECTCPRGQRKCNMLGNKCDCINGKYYMPGSNECVTNDEHCIIASPFGRAEVDSNETAVVIIENDH
ncbi:mucin-5B-like isoform X2 [Dermacentor silvarum]|nr:mucin-5B-like isoform X2 [Dermacentor silvarum]